MKSRFLILALTFGLSCFAQALTLDTETFGKSLNGWKSQAKIASYVFSDGKYRTHFPTATKTPTGGLFISTVIDQGRGSSNQLHLELTFAKDGRLVVGQVKGMVAGRKIDTGLVTLPEAPAAGAKAEALSPIEKMSAELFATLDAKILKNAEKFEEKEDFWGRTFGSKNKANLSGAVRHNFNFLVRAVK